MIARFASLFCAGVLLAGCQTLDAYLPSVGSSTNSPTESGNAPLAQRLAAPDSPSAPATSDQGTSEQSAAVFTSPIDDNPQQFMGLGQEAVAATLGDPDLTRRDGPAEIRQFRGQDCVLDLFLYPASGDLAVRHVELRGPSLTADARRACLVDMIRERSLTG